MKQYIALKPLNKAGEHYDVGSVIVLDNIKAKKLISVNAVKPIEDKPVKTEKEVKSESYSTKEEKKTKKTKSSKKTK